MDNFYNNQLFGNKRDLLYVGVLMYDTLKFKSWL